MLSNVRQSSSAPDLSVDFIVDVFDRADQDGLGRNWAYNSPNIPNLFSVRNKKAVGSSGGYSPIREYSLFAQYTKYGGPIIIGRVYYGLFSSVLKTGRSVHMYSNPMSSKDITVKIVFDGPPEGVFVLLPDPHAPGTDYETRDVIMPVASYGIAASAFFGIAGSSFTLPVGANVRAARAPAIPLPFSPTPAHTSSEVVYGSTFSTVSQVSVGKIIDPTVPPVSSSDGAGGDDINYFGRMPASTSVLPTGNALQMKFTGESVSVTLNGGAIFTGPSTLIDRGLVGLSAWPEDIVTACASLNIPVFGITSFKAWKNDMSEPPDQSGHGKVNANGTLAYTDFYHREVRNSDGVITGYTYLPNG